MFFPLWPSRSSMGLIRISHLSKVSNYDCNQCSNSPCITGRLKISLHISQNSYPHRCLPVILPLTQMSLMASVYCTILMSFERYVRICHLCQLRYNSWLSEKTFGFLIAFVTMFPICFYMPRFFEMRSKEDIKVIFTGFKALEILLGCI